MCILENQEGVPGFVFYLSNGVINYWKPVSEIFKELDGVNFIGHDWEYCVGLEYKWKIRR